MTRILKNSISRKILQLFHLYENYCILLLNKSRSRIRSFRDLRRLCWS